MKKLLFIAGFIACSHSAATSLPSQAESPVEQLVRIMLSNSNPKHQIPYLLTKNRNPNDYQDVYNLAKKHPELLKGIMYDGQTFAMLCVKRGYADVLERLINEGCPVDLAKACLLHGPNNPETTVLHALFFEIGKARFSIRFGCAYPEDYTARITSLIKLIISKYPDLLDIKVVKNRTARDYAIWEHNLDDLIPRDPSSCK